MSFRKSTIISVFVSLTLGLGMFYMAHLFLPSPSGEGYVVLSLDASYEDRYIGELLERGNWGNYISESTQWVFWDDFGELVQIALEAYGERVEPFDPRNDGYAGRLQSFFVHGDRRFFFIPLSTDFWGIPREKIEESLARCLAGIPFQVEFPGVSRPLWIYAFFFAAASVGMLLFSGAPWIGISLLPLLAALSYPGPAGFALSASLTALFGLLLQPLREFFIARHYRRHYVGINKKPVFFKSQWGMIPLFLVIYGVICYLGRFPVFLGAGGIFSFFLILGLSLWAESKKGTRMGHIRFIPVPISVPFSGIAKFSRIMLPFALGSLGALFLPPLILGSGYAAADNPPVSAKWQEYMINSEEYQAHAAFQASFSLRPLRIDGDTPDHGEYLRYHRADDGLIGEYSAVPDDHVREITPFPLEDLMNFLARREHIRPLVYTPGDLLSALMVLFFCIPIFFPFGRKHSKKKRLLVYNDKRIAA
ncbi:hypothetical protein LQZ21_05785 [Treponema sp. TIM-1]|uniref:hypothetical protein n=1 Tax=Treponema sp. TIM-1 TaxID=2898417 RepID=UPI003980B1E1